MHTLASPSTPTGVKAVMPADITYRRREDESQDEQQNELQRELLVVPGYTPRMHASCLRDDRFCRCWLAWRRLEGQLDGAEELPCGLIPTRTPSDRIPPVSRGVTAQSADRRSVAGPSDIWVQALVVGGPEPDVGECTRQRVLHGPLLADIKGQFGTGHEV